MNMTFQGVKRFSGFLAAIAVLTVTAPRAQELAPSMQKLMEQAKQTGSAMTARPKEDGSFKELAAKILKNQRNTRFWGEDIEVETPRVRTADGKAYSLSVVADQSLKNLRTIIAYEWTLSDIEDGKKASYRAVVVGPSGRPLEVRSGSLAKTARSVDAPGAGEAASFSADFKLFLAKLKVKDMADIFAALAVRGVPLNIGDPDGPRMLAVWKHGATSERWQVSYEGRVGQPGADFAFFKRLHTDDADGFVRKNDATLYKTDFKGNLRSMSRSTSDSTPADRAKPTRPSAADAAVFSRIVEKVFPSGR